MDEKQLRKTIVYNFLAAWRGKEYKAMKKFCQESWLKRQNDSAVTLEAMLDDIQPLKWRYVDEKRIGRDCYDVILICNYKKARKQKGTVLLRIIKEKEWGVNPISVVRKF